MWYSKPIEVVTETLKVNPKTGLSTLEAEQRLLQYGLNQLTPKKKKSLIKPSLRVTMRVMWNLQMPSSS